MKLFHVHLKSNVDVKLPEAVLKRLPKRLGIVTTIQHLHKIDDIVKQTKGVLAGQVLGCNASQVEKVNDDIDAFLFVGSGEFHPINVALKTGKKVWLWNPISKNFGLLDEKMIEKYRKQKQGKLSKFLNAKRVGIIVSTKMGQKNLMRAYELMKQSDREYYLFACDEVNFAEFENFNFIDFWVNTACPRIEDSRIIHIDDLIDAGLLKLKKGSYEVPIWKSDLGLH
ncbi:2-(3-amino-3-carboxypropyl)histidine synthase [uncultured archaeon]|nr:2-(3-amino-3-carboxypropyl)histidine synthase [uncultured archaeon]